MDVRYCFISGCWLVSKPSSPLTLVLLPPHVHIFQKIIYFFSKSEVLWLFSFYLRVIKYTPIQNHGRVLPYGRTKSCSYSVLILLAMRYSVKDALCVWWLYRLLYLDVLGTEKRRTNDSDDGILRTHFCLPYCKTVNDNNKLT